MDTEILGIAAGVLGLGGYIPYVISILRRETQPNRASWFIWTVVGGLLAVSYAAEGDSHAIWVPIGYFIGPLIVSFLSIKYGYASWTKLDTFCMVAACISIIPWWFSKDAIFTLLINLLIDMIGAVPTIVKTYQEPETEDLLAWTIFFIANTIQLFVIRQWDISSSYPIYLFFLAGSIFCLTFFNKLKKMIS